MFLFGEDAGSNPAAFTSFWVRGVLVYATTKRREHRECWTLVGSPGRFDSFLTHRVVDPSPHKRHALRLEG